MPRSLASAKDYLPRYFSSNWSFAKFSVAEPRCICAFAADNTSVIGKSPYAQYRTVFQRVVLCPETHIP
jgi:hypothetical protein